MNLLVGSLGTVVRGSSDPDDSWIRVQCERANRPWFFPPEAVEPAGVIQVGKFYRTRGGRKARIYSTDAGTDAAAMIHGAIRSRGGDLWVQQGWALDGSVCESQTDDDIIGEWVEPHPAESWPVDAKIQVRNCDSQGWVYRHFARYESGKVYAWDYGRTSFTSIPSDIVSWEQAELAD